MSVAPNPIERIAAELGLSAGDHGDRGPVPLAAYFEQTGLDHVELPNLTRGSVVSFLGSTGIPAKDNGDGDEMLAGFVFTAGPGRLGFRPCQ